MKTHTIFSYSLLHLSTTDKVRFYYALKGRDGKTGVVKQYAIEQLGRTVLFVQEKHSKAVQEFLEYWKCNFTKKEVKLLE